MYCTACIKINIAIHLGFSKEGVDVTGYPQQHGWGRGAHPTNDISIEFETRPKFALLWFKMYSTDHSKLLHTSRQHNFVVIGEAYSKLEHSKFWSNFGFDRNSVSGTDAWPPLRLFTANCHRVCCQRPRFCELVVIAMWHIDAKTNGVVRDTPP